MSTKRLYLLILLLIVGCQKAGISAGGPALPANKTEVKAELSKQLKIYESTLLEGKIEQIRIDAATEMLFSEDPLAREILLSALRQSENSAARMAVCKVLIQARPEQKRIQKKGDFIQPLLEILPTKITSEAKLAAEGLLIFEYEQISEPLEKVVTSPKLPVNTRLNAIYALKLQPYKQAVIRLLKLVNDPEKQVAEAAEKALNSLGITVGLDAEIRTVNILQSQNTDEFLRDRLIWLEGQMHKLKGELDLWEERYLSALDEVYSGRKDDVAKAEFLSKHLHNLEVTVRLWALDKVYQDRVSSTPNPQLPATLESILVNLISDPERNVRLKTAKLLALMVELNSAPRLLEQLTIEQYDEVRIELFVALGRACQYAFSANPGVKVLPEVRKQLLEWAEKYLVEQDPIKAQKGADVIKKVLEQGGLAPMEVDKYLGLLQARYKQEKGETDGMLRGELLTAMAGLCAQRSVCRAESSKLFESLFQQALNDETDLVRDAAVNGLIYIDKTKALNILRGFINDSNPIVRKKIIELASEVGSQEDLVWLSGKIGSSAEGESEPAWQAMLEIFKRSDADVLNEWITKFDSPSTKAKLSVEQLISFLEIAEGKAIRENKLNMLKDIREKLAGLYKKTGAFEQAAKYFGILQVDAKNVEERDKVLAELLDAYLRWPNVEAATKLVDNCLLEKDLDPNHAMVLAIDDYLSKPPAGVDPNEVLKALTTINPSRKRPKWLMQVKLWISRLR
ncbi:MAG: HEAT repeat domain-containing protein [Phycisphaerae bacterium]|nr:HEAT repeat domain-containing protein [Phycisphaerae bacterium]